jgi:hypothetical protein
MEPKGWRAVVRVVQQHEDAAADGNTWGAETDANTIAGFVLAAVRKPTHVVVIGNMARIVGPFPSFTEAQTYVEAVVKQQHVWDGYSTQIVEITAPVAQS